MKSLLVTTSLCCGMVCASAPSVAENSWKKTAAFTAGGAVAGASAYLAYTKAKVLPRLSIEIVPGQPMETVMSQIQAQTGFFVLKVQGCFDVAFAEDFCKSLKDLPNANNISSVLFENADLSASKVLELAKLFPSKSTFFEQKLAASAVLGGGLGALLSLKKPPSSPGAPGDTGQQGVEPGIVPDDSSVPKKHPGNSEVPNQQPCCAVGSDSGESDVGSSQGNTDEDSLGGSFSSEHSFKERVAKTKSVLRMRAAKKEQAAQEQEQEQAAQEQEQEQAAQEQEQEQAAQEQEQEQAAQEQERDFAATKIQSAWRVKTAKKELDSLKQEQAFAATKIQSAWRMKTAKKERARRKLIKEQITQKREFLEKLEEEWMSGLDLLAVQFAEGKEAAQKLEAKRFFDNALETFCSVVEAEGADDDFISVNSDLSDSETHFVRNFLREVLDLLVPVLLEKDPALAVALIDVVRAYAQKEAEASAKLLLFAHKDRDAHVLEQEVGQIPKGSLRKLLVDEASRKEIIAKTLMFSKRIYDFLNAKKDLSQDDKELGETFENADFVRELSRGVDRSGVVFIEPSKKEGEQATVWVVFKGTVSGADWTHRNLHADWTTLDQGLNGHAGFLITAQDQIKKIQEMIGTNKYLAELIQKGANVRFTGHSLGGALANVTGILFKQAYTGANVQVITYAAPSAISQKSLKDVHSTLDPSNILHISLAGDPVPLVCHPLYSTTGMWVRVKDDKNFRFWDVLALHGMGRYREAEQFILDRINRTIVAPSRPALAEARQAEELTLKIDTLTASAISEQKQIPPPDLNSARIEFLTRLLDIEKTLSEKLKYKKIEYMHQRIIKLMKYAYKMVCDLNLDVELEEKVKTAIEKGPK
jgi:chemotaxis protein histidine kinase CheA